MDNKKPYCEQNYEFKFFKQKALNVQKMADVRILSETPCCRMVTALLNLDIHLPIRSCKPDQCYNHSGVKEFDRLFLWLKLFSN